jgi:hypothetical protein
MLAAVAAFARALAVIRIAAPVKNRRHQLLKLLLNVRKC